MLNSLSTAINGIVDGDKIVTDKGVISCTITGKVVLTNTRGDKVTLGHISHGIPTLAKAFEVQK